MDRNNNTIMPEDKCFWRDTAVTLAIMAAVTIICALLQTLGDSSVYASMLYIMAVLVVARLTQGYAYGVVSAVVSVFLVNYVFTYPYMQFNFTISGYPVTFVSMLAVSITTSAMTSQIKQQDKVRSAAQHERIRGNLLRAISHDLRTPLTGIIGASSLLMEGGDGLSTQERKNLAAGIQEDAQWLLRMVENLLSITRIDDQVRRIVKNSEPVEEVIGAALMKIAKRYPSKKIAVKAPDDLLMVPMDPLLIEQVLINLMENAIRHGGNAQHISLIVSRTLDGALFAVEDDGRGIPKDKLEHLFDGVLQTNAVSDSSRGMGIGLSVCMSIIRAHGGRMWAFNREEGGAAIHFILPMEDDML